MVMNFLGILSAVCNMPLPFSLDAEASPRRPFRRAVMPRMTRKMRKKKHFELKCASQQSLRYRRREPVPTWIARPARRILFAASVSMKGWSPLALADSDTPMKAAPRTWSAVVTTSMMTKADARGGQYEHDVYA